MQRFVPWQALAAAILVYWIAYFFFVILAIACIWLRWPYVGAIMLLLAFVVLALAIPLNLNFGRHMFPHLLGGHLAHQIATILIYAGYFSMAGLRDSTGAQSMNFVDALYYSLATWTTLGAGDLMPPAHLRILTTFEALTAVLFVPVFAALFWMFLQEETVPPAESHLSKWQRRLQRDRPNNQ